MTRDVVASGGGECAGSTYSVRMTAGQAAAGVVSGTTYECELGFWHAMGNPSGVDDLAAVPHAFALAPRGPNPIRVEAILRFGVPRAGPVVIRLYDITGRQVQVLAAGEYAPGWHEARLRSRGLPSGVYLCRLRAGERTITRRFVLAK